MAIRREIVFMFILAVLYYPMYHVAYGPMSLVLVGWSPICIGALVAGLIIGLAGALLGLKPPWKVLVLPLVAEVLSFVVNLAVFGGLDNWRQAIYGSVEGGVSLPTALWWHSCGFLIASVGSGIGSLLKMLVDRLR